MITATVHVNGVTEFQIRDNTSFTPRPFVDLDITQDDSLNLATIRVRNVHDALRLRDAAAEVLDAFVLAGEPMEVK